MTSAVTAADFRGDRHHLLHFVLKLVELVKVDGAGGGLHLVDGVVHGADQAGDGAAVERRQEGAADAA